MSTGCLAMVGKLRVRFPGKARKMYADKRRGKK